MTILKRLSVSKLYSVNDTTNTWRVQNEHQSLHNEPRLHNDSRSVYEELPNVKHCHDTTIVIVSRKWPAVMRLVAVWAVALVAMIGANTYGVTVQGDAEERYAEFVNEENTAPRWCRWTLNVPGTALGQPGGTTLSGISEVELRNDFVDNGNSLRQYFVIHDFRGIGDLWFFTGKFALYVNGEPNGIERQASLGNTIIDKFLSADGSNISLRTPNALKTPTQGYNVKGKFVTFNDFNANFGNVRYNFPAIDEANTNEAGNLVMNFNKANGYILYFGSKDGKLPMTGRELPDGTIVDYYTDLTLEFLAGDPNTKIVSGEADAMVTKEYPSYIKAVDFDGTSGSITVNGLYGHAKEMRADGFNVVANKATPTFEEAPIAISLNADGTATIDRQWGTSGPILNTSWASMPLLAKGAEPDLQMDATNRNLWLLRESTTLKYYTDLLVAGDDLGTVTNASNDVIALHNRIQNSEFKPITGTWTVLPTGDSGNTDLPNSHWVRGDNLYTTSGNLSLSFAPHYILPLIYMHNEYYGDPDIPYTAAFVIDVAEPTNIETLTLTVPVDGLTVQKPTFTCENYGNEDLGSGRGRHLYITGTVTNADDVFIVRGTLPDYSAAEMSDIEKGHTGGLLISDGKYDYTYDAATTPTANATTDDTKSKRISVLIPNDDIPGSASSINVYTLYSRTKTTNGYRFDYLDELNSITTRVSEVTTDHTTLPAYRLDGHTITALTPAGCGDLTVVVTDITGRTVATLASGQSATLIPGHYLVTVSSETATATTHILVK